MFTNKTWKELLEEKPDVLWTPDTSRVMERAEEKRKKRLREKINSQLKPCPFCGGPAKIIEKTEPDGYCSYTVKLVRCEACHAQTEGRTADGYYGEYCSDKEIAECWNRRWILK